MTRVAEALGDRALVAYFYDPSDDRLHALLLVDGRCRVVSLSSYADALNEAESLRFAMHRIARRHGSEASLALAHETRAHAAAALDDALLELEEVASHHPDHALLGALGSVRHVLATRD